MENFWDLRNADFFDASGLKCDEDQDYRLDEEIERVRDELFLQYPDMKDKLENIIGLYTKKYMVQNEIGFKRGYKMGFECCEQLVVKKDNQFYKKPSKLFTDRCFAYALMRLTYSDIKELSELHTQKDVRTFDMEFYKYMLTSVERLYNQHISLVSKIFAYESPINQDESDWQEHIGYLIAQMPELDDPSVIDDLFYGNVAEYLLSGEFKTACANKVSLSDYTRRRLDQDVYNRYFTLLQKGHIPNDI